MSIIYVCVSSNKQILCSYAEQKYDFDTAINGLFKHIEPNSKGSFEYTDQCMFFTWDESNYTFIAMCGKDYPPETAFFFLGKVKDEFFKSKSNMKPKLQSLFQHYNQNKDVPEDNKLVELKQGLLSMKNQVLEANELLDARGQKLNLMLEKSEGLKEDSQTFYNVAKKVKKDAVCRKYKWRIIGGLIILVIIIFLVIYLVSKSSNSGGSSEQNTGGDSEPTTGSLKKGDDVIYLNPVIPKEETYFLK